MEIKTKISELSSFYNNEYIITNSLDDATEIHGIAHTLTIDGNKINEILISRSHIYFTLNDNREIKIYFKKLPKFFDL